MKQSKEEKREPSTQFIIHKMKSCVWSHENYEMYLSTSVSSGKTDVVIKRWCSHRMPIEDLWNAEWLYELFNKDGRFIVSLTTYVMNRKDERSTLKILLATILITSFLVILFFLIWIKIWQSSIALECTLQTYDISDGETRREDHIMLSDYERIFSSWILTPPKRKVVTTIDCLKRKLL